jgi:hypothetical protein
MSLINTQIKPFKAQALKDGKFVEITEASLKGKWSVVVFYPADFTFVCPTELEDLADNYAALQKMGVEVYSVSTDTEGSFLLGAALAGVAAGAGLPVPLPPRLALTSDGRIALDNSIAVAEERYRRAVRDSRVVPAW